MSEWETDTVPPVETYFKDCYDWVDEWMLPRYCRKRSSVRWDPRWFENLEAVDRIESLWRAWEYYRLQGMTGMSTYWIGVFDPMMREITSPDGVFWYVTEYGSEDGSDVPVEQLASERAPADARW